MLYAGLDLSRKRLDFHLLDSDGATVEVGAAPPDADGLLGLTRRLDRHREPIRAAIESMNGARFVHDRLELAGWQVEIADAQKVKGLAPLACKTDRIDAWVLAELTRRDLVPAIWLPDPMVRAERERARWRLHLVRHRSSLKQRVHAVLLTQLCAHCYQRRWALRDRRALIVTRVRDDQEARLAGISREVPHRAPEHVLEDPEPVLGVYARAVVRLLLDELGRCRHARQTEHVQAPRCRLTIGSERRPARDHRVSEPIHVRPMLFEQPCVVAQRLGARSVAAVDEEIHPEARLDGEREFPREHEMAFSSSVESCVPACKPTMRGCATAP
jgi:hypothetical protein